MKKLIFTALAIMALQFTIFAQGGNFQRQTVEERVAVIHNKLDSAFKLAPEKLATLDKAMTVLYKAEDDRMKEVMAGGERPDRDALMAERKKYTDARDAMIKEMVTADQYKTWIDTIEPSMRTQRQGGGGRGGN